MKTPLLGNSRLRLGLCAGSIAGVFATAAWAALQFSSLDAQPVGFVAPVEFSTFDIASGKAVIFRGDYVRATWEGDLVAEKLLSDGSLDSVKWNARHELLPTATSWDTDRKIYTRNGTGVPFRFANLSNTQKGNLAGNDTDRQKVLNYLRGDATNEYTPTNTAGTYRYRFSKMGAVIHSRPYYYEHGKDASGNPIGRVYVGANDGMLHSFDAETGKEVFAFVPSVLFPKLKNLTANTNPPNYDYYVDGPITIGKVPQTSGGDRTLLIGSLGGGGNGLYALDITEPSPAAETTAVAAALVKWEITDAVDAYRDDLGHVYGAPQIVKLNDGRTVVISPNGVNSDKGTAKLFVIDAANGTKIAEISAGAGDKNGLGAIAVVDYQSDGKVDAVYAGDQKGTLWKFNLSGNTLPTTATALYTPPTGTLRPITAAPSVMAHPMGGYLVNFGTGRTMEPNDLTSTANEYLYGIWDGAPNNNNQVIDQTLTAYSVTVGSETTNVRVASSSNVNYNANARGWRITLAGGERLIGADTLVDSGRYVVTTAIPNTGSTQGAWLLQVDALTGSGPSSPFFDLTGDARVNGDDRVAVPRNGSTQTDLVAPVGKSLGTGVWSQPVYAQLNSLQDVPYFNYNANVMVPATTMGTVSAASSTGGPGVAGGHFDFDIYYGCTFSSSGYPCTGRKHTHAYDDKFNVVGVNLLNASDPAFNLDKPMPSTATPRFKVLLGNTRWSPAATMIISGRSTSGGVAKDVTMQELGWQFPVSPGGFLSDTPGGEPMTFTRADLAKFTFSLKSDSFAAREWIPGSGDVRAGLIPSSTGCVTGNRGGGVSEGGAWMNGAFVFQLVKDTTPDSAVAPVSPADAGGFLLKKDAASQANQVVQYTAFWHHGACYGSPNWTKAPAPELISRNNRATPPPGTGDPTGSFVYSGGSTTTTTSGKGKRAVTTSVTMYNGVEVTVARDFADSGFRQIITRKSDGVVLDDTLSAVGETQQANLQQGSRPRTGRLAWKELLR